MRWRKFHFFGSALAEASTSANVFSGRLALTTQTSGATAVRAITVEVGFRVEVRRFENQRHHRCVECAGKQGVAVGIGLKDRLGPNHTCAADTVFDNGRDAILGLKPLGQQPTQRVIRGARRPRNDHLDGPLLLRPCRLCHRRGLQRRQRRDACCRLDQIASPHRASPLVFGYRSLLLGCGTSVAASTPNPKFAPPTAAREQATENRWQGQEPAWPAARHGPTDTQDCPRPNGVFSCRSETALRSEPYI